MYFGILILPKLFTCTTTMVLYMQFIHTHKECACLSDEQNASDDIYVDDKLWDGKQCAREGERCSSTCRSISNLVQCGAIKDYK